MRSLLEIFRNYLHKQTAGFLTTENYLITVKNFLSQQGINAEKFSLKNINDVLMLQSFFNFQKLRQFKAEVGVSDENFFALYALGKFLVSQSFLSENPAERLTFPAEKVWKIPAESAEFKNYKLRELNFLQGSTLFQGGTLNFLWPAFVFVFVILIAVLSIGWWRKPSTLLKRELPSTSFTLSEAEVLRAGKFAKTDKRIFRLELTRKVYAQERNKALDLINNLSTEEKIVSSSAEKVTK